jgi:photosynthetic reaction center cytochrome c subunit
VTCYTCHRGQPVPSNIWFEEPPPAHDDLAMGGKAGQNAPSATAGVTSLPGGMFRPFLVDDEPIRVIGTETLPHGNPASIKQAEWTYGLMMNISSSLGVNCTYCHNTRSFAQWEVSPPARATAWYGIRMVRDLNNAYLVPLTSQFPASRLGTLGDAPKVNCATCHQGVFKPLLGVSMLNDYAVLAEAKPQPQKKPPEPVAVPVTDGDAGAAAAGDGGTAPSTTVAGDAGAIDASAPRPRALTDAGR